MDEIKVRLSNGELYWSGKGVGGMWDVIGQLQFDFLLKEGLQPYHNFLDIACGSLRGGVHFLDYLDSGHYFGIEKQEYLIKAAEEYEIPRYQLNNKTVTLICRDDFDGSGLGIDFDYVLAFSLFTHLAWNSILRCLARVEQVLQPEGKFYASFFEDVGYNFTSGIQHSPTGIVTFPDKNPYHYRFEVFTELAKLVNLKVTYIGDFDHPRNQKMMVFEKNGNR